MLAAARSQPQALRSRGGQRVEKMKNWKIFLITAALTFAAVLSLLTVDRRAALTYEEGGIISQRLQFLIENLLDLH